MKDQVAAISKAVNRVIEFDNKIAEDRHSYSAWILAVATAGFVLAGTQVDKVLDRSLLPATAANRTLNFASALFLLSAVAGALVKHFTNKELEYHRQQMTLILRQHSILAADISRIPAYLRDQPEDLIAAVSIGEFLPEANKKQSLDFRDKSNQGSGRYEKFLVAQQVLVAAAYSAVFIASVGYVTSTMSRRRTTCCSGRSAARPAAESER